MVFKLTRGFGVVGLLAAIGITLLCVLPKQSHVENDLTTPPPTPDGNIRGPSTSVVDVSTDLPVPPPPEARVGTTTTGTGGGSVPTTTESGRVDGRGGSAGNVGGSVPTTAESARVDGRSGNVEGDARTASGTNNVRVGGTTSTTGTSTTTTITTTTSGSSDSSGRANQTPAATGKLNNGSGSVGTSVGRTGQTSTKGEGADCVGPKCSGPQSESGNTSRPEGDGGSTSSPEANSGSSSATADDRGGDDGTSSATGGKGTVKQPVRGAPSTDDGTSLNGTLPRPEDGSSNPHASNVKPTVTPSTDNLPAVSVQPESGGTSEHDADRTSPTPGSPKAADVSSTTESSGSLPVQPGQKPASGSSLRTQAGGESHSGPDGDGGRTSIPDSGSATRSETTTTSGDPQTETKGPTSKGSTVSPPAPGSPNGEGVVGSAISSTTVSSGASRSESGIPSKREGDDGTSPESDRRNDGGEYSTPGVDSSSIQRPENGSTSRPEGDIRTPSDSASKKATDVAGSDISSGGKSTPPHNPANETLSSDAGQNETGIPSGPEADTRNSPTSEDQIPSLKTPESESRSTHDVQPIASVQQPANGKDQGDGVTTVLSPHVPSDTQLNTVVKGGDTVVNQSPLGPGVSSVGVTGQNVQVPGHADQASDPTEQQSDISSADQPRPAGFTSGQQRRSDASQPDVNTKHQVDPIPAQHSTNTVPPEPSTGNSQPSSQDASSSSTTVTRSSEPASGPGVSSDGSYEAKVGSDESASGQKNTGYNLHSGSSVSTGSSQTPRVTNGSSSDTSVQSAEDSPSQTRDHLSGEGVGTSDASQSRENSRITTPALPAAPQGASQGASDTSTTSENDRSGSSNAVSSGRGEENSGITRSPSAIPSSLPSQPVEGDQKVDARASTDQNSKADTETHQDIGESSSSSGGEPSASVDGIVASSAEVSSDPGSTVAQGGSEGRTSQGTGTDSTSTGQAQRANQAESHEGGGNSVDDGSNPATDPTKIQNGDASSTVSVVAIPPASGGDNHQTAGSSLESTTISQGVLSGAESGQVAGDTSTHQTSQQPQGEQSTGDTKAAVSSGNTETQNPTNQDDLTTNLGNQIGQGDRTSDQTPQEKREESAPGKTVDGSGTGVNQPTADHDGMATSLEKQNGGGGNANKLKPEEERGESVNGIGQNVTGDGVSPRGSNGHQEESSERSTNQDSNGLIAGVQNTEGQDGSVSEVRGITSPSIPSSVPSGDHQQDSTDMESKDVTDNVQSSGQGDQSIDGKENKASGDVNGNSEQSESNQKNSTDGAVGEGLGDTNEDPLVTQNSSSDSGRVAGDSSSSIQQPRHQMSQSVEIDLIEEKSPEDQQSGGPKVDTSTGNTVIGVGVSDPEHSQGATGNLQGQVLDSGSTGIGGSNTGSEGTDTETVNECDSSSGQEGGTAPKQEERQSSPSPAVGEKPVAQSAEQKQQNNELSSPSSDTDQDPSQKKVPEQSNGDTNPQSPPNQISEDGLSGSRGEESSDSASEQVGESDMIQGGTDTLPTVSTHSKGNGIQPVSEEGVGGQGKEATDPESVPSSGQNLDTGSQSLPVTEHSTGNGKGQPQSTSDGSNKESDASSPVPAQSAEQKQQDSEHSSISDTEQAREAAQRRGNTESSSDGQGLQEEGVTQARQESDSSSDREQVGDSERKQGNTESSATVSPQSSENGLQTLSEGGGTGQSKEEIDLTSQNSAVQNSDAVSPLPSSDPLPSKADTIVPSSDGQGLQEEGVTQKLSEGGDTALKQEEHQTSPSPTDGESQNLETAEQKQQDTEHSPDGIEQSGDSEQKQHTETPPTVQDTSQSASDGLNDRSETLSTVQAQTEDNGKSKEDTDSTSPPNQISENGTPDSRVEESSDSALEEEDGGDDFHDLLTMYPSRPYCPGGSC